MSERSRRTLLALSLALNMLCVGAAAGASAMWYWNRLVTPAAQQQGLWLAAKGLSPAQRKTFRQMLAEARREVRQDTEKARIGREQVAGLLMQDKLDTEAINAELVKIRGADAVLRARLEQAVISFAQTLSADDRQIFVEGLRERGSILRRGSFRKN
jgi:uncharacterized membrane protein